MFPHISGSAGSMPGMPDMSSLLRDPELLAAFSVSETGMTGQIDQRKKAGNRINELIQ